MKAFGYTIIVIASFIMVACSESKSDEDSYLRVEPETLTFPAEGGSKTFKVMCNTSWTIVVPEDSRISINATSGKDDKELQISMSKANTPKETELRVVIKSADNKVANLVVRQAGVFLSGGVLQVTNLRSFIVGGHAGERDSLTVLSSVPWKLYGPDWLEVWDGSRWLELSPSRAVIERGTSDPDGDFVEKVLLRAKYDNNNEDMRESQIKLVPAYDNTADVADISAIQLGRHHVLPNRMIALATELACDWKCGLDVSYIACYLSDHQLNWDAEASQMDWERSETSYVVGWTDLKENSMYYLYTIGYDNAGESYQHYVSFNMTASSQNQAIAYIQNVNYNGTKWTWDTKMNSYCKAYMMWASYDEEYFNLTDGIIAWFMDNESRKDNKTEEISYNSIDNNFWWELNGHLQIVTQGVGHDGNKTAGVIDRYRSIDYYQAPIRRAHFYSVPIDKDIFKNSFIRIK